MGDAIYPALSAFRALGKKLEVTANNVANVNTEGFKKSRGLPEEASPLGVTVSISRIDTPGFPLPSEDGTGETRESSNVAIEEEKVNLATLQHGYAANLETVRVVGAALGTLLDILG